MTKEEIAVIPKSIGEDSQQKFEPTELSFIFREARTGSFYDFAIAGRRYSDAKWKSGEKGEAERVKFEREIDRQNKIRNDTVDLAKQFTSYVTTSSAYLRISETLKAYGATEEEAADFFSRCFESNSSQHDLYSNREKMMYSVSKDGDLELGRRILEMAGEPPRWFRGKKNSYLEFFFQMQDFTGLLNQGSKKKIFRASEGDLGYTLREWTPDWMDDINEEPPAKEEVAQELEEDKKEWSEILNHVRKIDDKCLRIADIHNERAKKTNLFFEKWRRIIRGQVDSFPKFLTYINFSYGSDRYFGDLSAMQELDGAELEKRYLCEFDEALPLEIDGYIDENPVGEDMMAIWLEKRFRHAGLPADMTIDEPFIQKIELLEEDRQSELKDLKENDKNLYRLLNYELKPILNLMSSGEQDYFFDLLKISRGESVNMIINELGYLFANAMRDGDSDGVGRIRKEVKRFSKVFIKENWSWLIGKVSDSLGSEEQASIQQEFEQPVEYVEPYDEGVEEFSPFSGWNVSYTPDRNPNSEDLIDINLNTDSKGASRLERMLASLGQQVNIKNSSVINALEWATTIPADILAVWPRKNIDGNEFLKVKRGSARIFFQINSDEKRLVFFVHQKKAWTYGF